MSGYETLPHGKKKRAHVVVDDLRLTFNHNKSSLNQGVHNLFVTNRDLEISLNDCKIKFLVTSADVQLDMKFFDLSTNNS
jgi:hypothetical protein